MTDTDDDTEATRKPYWAGRRPGLPPSKIWPPGAELAALRRGLGREPGTVPAMWPFYLHLRTDGTVSKKLSAEHAALTLFAVHQQSHAAPMHRTGPGLGTAMRALRDSGKFSDDAVDRRFSAAATATSLTELTLHLRGLVTQLRTIPQPLDYDALFKDLVAWQSADQVGAVRRRWGSQYFLRPAAGDGTSTPDDPTSTSTGAQQ
ncbi:MAG TPA: type I-E CRISPR-associated protein Cse2/CasB [Pseudonocardiaceae bacterium]